MPKDPNELVRAKMPSGGENTVRRSYAEKHKLTIKEGKAVIKRGRPVPAKPKNSLPRAGSDEGNTTTPGNPLDTGSGEPPALMS